MSKSEMDRQLPQGRQLRDGVIVFRSKRGVFMRPVHVIRNIEGTGTKSHNGEDIGAQRVAHHDEFVRGNALTVEQALIGWLILFGDDFHPGEESPSPERAILLSWSNRSPLVTSQSSWSWVRSVCKTPRAPSISSTGWRSMAWPK